MIVQFLNGETVDLAKYNCAVESYYPPSMAIVHDYANVDGRSAPITTKTSFNGRTIPVNFVYKADDATSFDLIRDEIYALFTRKEAFFIVFKDKMYKRWLVKLESQFTIEPELDVIGTFSINFVTQTGYAESVGTSLDLVLRNFDAGLWGFGSGIDTTKEYEYEHHTTAFSVWNIGNELIDPCQHELEITIVAEVTEYLELTNMTTGETYRFNESLTANDILVIDGVRTLKNGVTAFNMTNHELISLAAGENRFLVSGASSIIITFNFRFLYK